MSYLEMSPEVQALLRTSYGLLTLLLLGLSLPNAHRFFSTEKYGGYAESNRLKDILLSPFGRVLILSSWTCAACWLLAGKQTVVAALFALICCRYFFVSARWTSIARGMGAPGFMLYWLGALVFMLEYTSQFDEQGTLRAIVLLAFKVDFAVIFLCAGQYKLFSGYPQNNGMERGMVNPWWGYWWKQYRTLPPKHWVFRTLNHLAYTTELVTGALMLIPLYSEWGALILAGTFVFIGCNIRLGFLCETVIACCFLFGAPGGMIDTVAKKLFSAPTSTVVYDLNHLNTLLAAFFLFYLIMLPVTKGGLYWNFYARKRLPEQWQKWQDFWANLMGIIIWRVFTIDNTNFYVKAWFEDRTTRQRTLYSKVGQLDAESDFRYLHVCEFVCFASVFTTLKYFPSDSDLFLTRVTRYARSMPVPHGHDLVFEYVDIKKTERFEDVSSREFRVDPRSGTVTETNLADGRSRTDNLRFSDLHQGHRVGSYAPGNP